MKKEIPFGDVPVGSVFRSNKTKRSFGGIRIETITARKPMTSEGVFVANAVILTDHVGERAHDAGTLININDHRIVEIDVKVEKPKKMKNK